MDHSHDHVMNTLKAYRDCFGEDPSEDDESWVFESFEGFGLFTTQQKNEKQIMLLPRDMEAAELLDLGIRNTEGKYFMVYSSSGDRLLPLTTRLSALNKGEPIRFATRSIPVADQCVEQLSFKDLQSGEKFCLDVDLGILGDFVFEVKQKISFKKAIPPAYLTLSYASKTLEDDKRLSLDYNVNEKFVLLVSIGSPVDSVAVTMAQRRSVLGYQIY